MSYLNTMYSILVIGTPIIIATAFIQGTPLFLSKSILLTAICLVLIAGAFICKENFAFKKEKTLWIISGFYFASQILSFTLALNQHDALLGIDARYYGFLPQISAFIFFIIIANYKIDRQKLNKILRWFLIPMIFLMVFGVIQYFGNIPGFSKDFFQGRIDSLLGNPNSYALFVLLNYPLFVYMRKIETNKKLKFYLYRPVLFVFIFSLLITESRTALIIVLIETIIFVLYFFGTQIKTKKEKKSQPWLKSIALIFLILVSILIGSQTFAGRLDLEPNSIISLQTRIQIWKGTLPVIMKSPFWGYGQDQFKSAFANNSNSELLKEPVTVDRAHNLFLDILVEKGFIGLLTFLFLVIFVLYKAATNLKKVEQNQYFLMLALIITVMNYLIFLQLNFTDPVNETYFFGCLGLLYNLSYQKK